MSLSSPITIAIDGYAGCGKSTTAQAVARHLNYLYIDTGAMYRSVSLYFLRNGIDFSADTPELQAALENIHLNFERQEGQSIPVITLNGEAVEPEIRSLEVSNIVSQVSVHPSVRHAMVAQQRRIGANGGVVMDGRDIGTYVFPNAELKVFMQADLAVRAQRRLEEMQAKGREATLESVIENLRERDRIDTTRKMAPLSKAEDALVLDTTHLTIEQQVQQVCEWTYARVQPA